MKLNHDCIRDVLKQVENDMHFTEMKQSLSLNIDGYSHDEVTYTLMLLVDSGYVVGDIRKYNDGAVNVLYKHLTMKGHELLDNIRDDNVWKSTKEKLNKISSVSIGIINEVASQIISNILSKQLGL